MSNNYVEKKEKTTFKLIIASIFTFLFPYIGIPVLFYKYFSGRNKTFKKSYVTEYETEMVRDNRFKGGLREQIGDARKVAISQKMSGYEQENYDKKIKGYLYIAIGFSAFWILVLIFDATSKLFS